jgi:hypothetical protein
MPNGGDIDQGFAGYKEIRMRFSDPECRWSSIAGERRNAR